MSRVGDAIERRERAIARRPTMKTGVLLEIDSLGSNVDNDDNYGGQYEYNSSPRALYNNRKFVAGGDAPLPYANLMFDRRIRRGSNFAQLPMGGEGESAAARAAEARRRSLARTKAKEKMIRGAQLRLGSPPPVPGRKHEPVQTDQYLEEIWSNPTVADVCTQTDLRYDRPISPYYVPCKTGIDNETQIYPGDLFDFDMEVQPILEVLVGKTIEQALMEVLEEEELAAIREQQRRFIELRATDIAEAQRLEERERRLQREKELRMKEYAEGLAMQREMEERIAACVLMQRYLADLLPRVLEGLEEEGFLVDNIKHDVDDNFMPWLMKEVTLELKEVVSCRDLLIEIVKEVVDCRADQYKALFTRVEEPEGEEEGADYLLDPDLKAHLKLKEEIMKNVETEKPPEH